MKFGVITDVQYADIEPWAIAPEREFRLAPQKLSSAIEFFNQQDLAFVVHLGDLVDKYEQSFDQIGEVLSGSRHGIKHVLGNHDFKATDDGSRIPAATVLEKLGLDTRYYSFQQSNWKFIVLDTNEVGVIEQDTEAYVSEGKRLLSEAKQSGKPNAHGWNGAISLQQELWLKQELEQAEKADTSVIIFAHHPVAPLIRNTALAPERITQFFPQFTCIKAYMNGHHHEGSFALQDGVPCVTFKALLDTKENSYAVVTLTNSGIDIEGFDREESRALEIR